MSRVLRLREVSQEEAEQVHKLASSRTQPLRLVQRAQIIQHMLDNPKLHAGEAGRMVGYKSDYPGCTWVKRFNQQGIKGLQDEERSGRPPSYNESIRGSLLSMALQKPASLGYPFTLWTESRLQIAFRERYGIHLSTYTIWTWVTSEGLKWKRQQSWFHDVEKHDPEFAQKRGLSSRHTLKHIPHIPVDVSLNPYEPG